MDQVYSSNNPQLCNPHKHQRESLQRTKIITSFLILPTQLLHIQLQQWLICTNSILQVPTLAFYQRFPLPAHIHNTQELYARDVTKTGLTLVHIVCITAYAFVHFIDSAFIGVHLCMQLLSSAHF